LREEWSLLFQNINWKKEVFNQFIIKENELPENEQVYSIIL